MSSAVTLRKIIDSIKDLVKQVNLEASLNGLSLQAMDSAHVSLVSLMLKEDGFDTYRCDKTMTLGIDLNDLGKILKMSGNEDTVSLKADEESSFLTIVFENKKTEKVSEFQLNLLNIDSDSLGIPETEYPTSVEMSSSEFVKTCKELMSLSDTIKVDIQSDKEAVLSYNGKTGQGKVRLRKHLSDKDDDAINITCEEEISSNYGLNYLNSFSKASSLSSRVVLEFSTKYPLRISYEVENLGWIKFYLAPKMDEDMES